jgi:hypothetical protein
VFVRGHSGAGFGVHLLLLPNVNNEIFLYIAAQLIDVD